MTDIETPSPPTTTTGELIDWATARTAAERLSEAFHAITYVAPENHIAQRKYLLVVAKCISDVAKALKLLPPQPVVHRVRSRVVSVTDEQIRKLIKVLENDLHNAGFALLWTGATSESLRTATGKARARCAEILSEREESK